MSVMKNPIRKGARLRRGRRELTAFIGQDRTMVLPLTRETMRLCRLAGSVKKTVVTRAQKRRMGVDGIRRCERESTVERSGTRESVVDDPFRWQTTTHGALLKYKAAWEAGFSVPSQAVGGGPRSARGSSHLVFCLHTVKSGIHQNSMPPSDFSPSHRPTRQYIHTTGIGTFVYDLLRILLPNRRLFSLDTSHATLSTFRCYVSLGLCLDSPRCSHFLNSQHRLGALQVQVNGNKITGHRSYGRVLCCSAVARPGLGTCLM